MRLNALYIRTVYWFGLTSGGSVGHTAGVINALYDNCTLNVVSNDKLCGVKNPIDIIKPFLGKLLLPEYNELIYNFIIKKKLRTYLDGVDFIYQRYSGFSFVGCMLAKRENKKFVLEFNSSDVWKLKNWSQENNVFVRIFKMLMKRVFLLPIAYIVENYNLNNADLIVVISDVLKEQLVKRGFSENRILVNPNGVDQKIYYPERDGASTRNKLNIRNTDIVLGFIGTFSQWHGVIEMANAIVSYCKKYPTDNVKFMFVGEGKLLGKTKSIIKGGNVSDKVIFTGPVPQEGGPDYLAACDILLSPNTPTDGKSFFGSPTKLFEYMAMSKGIIASNINQLGEILTNEETALLTEPGNVDQIVVAMNKLINDKELRERLGKKAREVVVADYTWDIHVKRIINRIK